MLIQLSLPPTLNATYKTGQGRFYKSQEVKDWEEEAFWILTKEWWKKKPLKGPIYISITYFLTRDRDWDSSLKVICDVLQKAGVYANDSQIVHGNVKKFKVKENPRLEIEVEEVDEVNVYL